ncbi:Uncharacterized protein HZ326_30274 [Fusarium oxysporum f. sp. albedinis]|nr:Uncharacterized protein HZ326_31746 [Fusarium oxysporum f. sp. albedinis]KAJ0126619.1 Uncharacterized protein HZ326_30274 [Fusarium oxysporum f. sp. albedinis]
MPLASSPESPGQAGPGGDSSSCIIVNAGDIDSIAPAVSPTAPSIQAGTQPTLRYDDPRAIYQRYVAARDAWYKAQLRGSVKTN